MTFYTSDQHFGHANIIRLCNRPFATVEEMDETMLANWNAKVGKGDTVYVLGDLFFRAASVKPILERLNGRKHLMIGNHDSSWMDRVDLSVYFESVQLMKEVEDGGRRITLCHYPMMTWHEANNGYMVFGHIHANTNADYWPLIAGRTRMFNAGVEVNGYAPVTFDELVRNNQVFNAAHKPAENLIPSPE